MLKRHPLFLTLAAALVTATPTVSSGAIAPFAIRFKETPPQAPTASSSSTVVFDFVANRNPVSYQCSLDGAASKDCAPPVTYRDLSNAAHNFSVVATYTDPSSGRPITTSASWQFVVTAAPNTQLTDHPAAKSTATNASFSFTSDVTGSTFECSLDNSVFTACVSPQRYDSLSIQQHIFAVRASSAELTDQTPATYSWTIGSARPTAFDTLLTNRPLATTASGSASFSFVSKPAGAAFQCALDKSPFVACTSPWPYSGLAVGGHRFRVRAVSGASADSSPANAAWRILPVVPTLNTRLIDRPGATTTSTTATFAFVSAPSGATFECALDRSPFGPCASPKRYEHLANGAHRFRVRAVAGVRRDLTPAAAGWEITSTPPVPNRGGGVPPWLPLSGAAILLALGGGAAIAWDHARISRRRGVWQLEASDEEPPHTCKVPQHHTWRHSCTATPSLWKVKSLEVRDANSKAEHGAHAIESESIVGRLNEALHARRTFVSADRLKAIVQPIAKDLSGEVEDWFAATTEGLVADVMATLIGCEFECEFTHYECVAAPAGASHWRKREVWKGKVEARAKVPVASVTRLSRAKPESVGLVQIETGVLSFVNRVDIPWKMRQVPAHAEAPDREWADGLGRLPQN